MAMNTNYTIEFKSYSGILYKIELIEDGGSGSYTDMKVGADGFILSTVGDETDRYSPIIGTSARVPLMISTQDHEDFINAIIGSQEQKYYIKISQYTTSYVPIFYGLVLQDLIQKEDISFPYIVELEATDGLGRLKEIKYSTDGTDDGDEYTGHKRLTTICANILTKIGTSELTGTTSFLLVGLNWYETQTYLSDPTIITGAGALYNSTVDPKTWTKINDDGTKEYKTCYEVLSQILICFGARIQMGNAGLFSIQQITEYKNTNQLFRIYDSVGLQTGSWNGVISISTISKLAGNVYNFSPAIHKVTTRYAYKQSQYQGLPSFIPHLGPYTSFTALENINGGSGEQLCLIGTVKILYNNGGTPAQPFLNRFRIRMEVDTFELSGEDSVMSWENATSYYYMSSPYMVSNGLHYANIYIVTPPIIASGMLSFQLVLDDVYDQYGNVYSPPGSISYTYQAFNLFFYDADNNLGEGNKVAVALNNIVGTSTLVDSRYAYETETLDIGDTVFLFSLGGIKVYNATTSSWEFSEGWKYAGDGTAYSIEKLRAIEILSTQRMFRQLFQLSVVTSEGVKYGFHCGLDIDSTKYMPCNVEFIANRDEITGSYFEIYRTITSIKPDELLKPIRPLPGVGANNKNIHKSINSIILNDQITKTTAAITGGVPLLSISISAINTRVINGTDLLTIVNYLGQYETFTAIYDVAPTDTIIAITPWHTFTYDYPVGSIIKMSDNQSLKSVKDLRKNKRTITDSTTMEATDQVVLLDGRSNDVVFTLFQISRYYVQEKLIYIKCIDATNSVTIVRSGSDLIDGKTSLTLQENSAVLLYCDGSSYKILSTAGPAFMRLIFADIPSYPATNILWVDGERGDTYTADGTILRPYKTFNAALAAVSSASASNQWTLATMDANLYSEQITLTTSHDYVHIYAPNATFTSTSGMTAALYVQSDNSIITLGCIKSDAANLWCMIRNAGDNNTFNIKRVDHNKVGIHFPSAYIDEGTNTTLNIDLFLLTNTLSGGWTGFQFSGSKATVRIIKLVIECTYNSNFLISGSTATSIDIDIDSVSINNGSNELLLFNLDGPVVVNSRINIINQTAGTNALLLYQQINSSVFNVTCNYCKINELVQIGHGGSHASTSSFVINNYDTNFTALHPNGTTKIKLQQGKTSNFSTTATIAWDDDICICSSAAAYSLSFPDFTGWTNKMIKIKNTGTGGNDVTLDPYSTGTIDGSSTLALSDGVSVELLHVGSNAFITL